MVKISLVRSPPGRGIDTLVQAISIIIMMVGFTIGIYLRLRPSTMPLPPAPDGDLR